MNEPHAQAAEHGTIQSYLTGFVASVILTVIPFALVMSGALPRWLTGVGIVVFAVLQILVQLKYFLHLGMTTRSGRLNTITFIFTALVIGLLVVLSIWIITSADALMMR